MVCKLITSIFHYTPLKNNSFIAPITSVKLRNGNRLRINILLFNAGNYMVLPLSYRAGLLCCVS